MFFGFRKSGIRYPLPYTYNYIFYWLSTQQPYDVTAGKSTLFYTNRDYSNYGPIVIYKINQGINDITFTWSSGGGAYGYTVLSIEKPIDANTITKLAPVASSSFFYTTQYNNEIIYLGYWHEDYTSNNYSFGPIILHTPKNPIVVYRDVGGAIAYVPKKGTSLEIYSGGSGAGIYSMRID
jgi:hypothetical protein